MTCWAARPVLVEMLGSVLLTLAALVAACYFYFEHTFSFWKRRGVPHPKPWPLFGNAVDFFKGDKPFAQVLVHYATQFKEHGYCGFFQFAKPVLLVFEPEMVKQILTKDFSSFHDRGVPHDVERDPLSGNLFALGGPHWKNLRIKMTPTFTSGKLKLMQPLIEEVAEELVVSLAEAVDTARGAEINVSHFLSLFSTDVIGTCAFGIQCHCLRDGKNEFLSMSQGLSRETAIQTLRNILHSFHPKLANLVPLKFMFPHTHNFFLNLVTETVAHREQTQVTRNDFVQLMMQLRDADLANTDPDKHLAITPSVMAAQALVFFIAGLDNITNTVGFVLSRLASDPELQGRVASEVRDVLADGGMSYEALKRMSLVERVVREGLRLWSPVGFLIRQCNATTRVGDILVEKGQVVFVTADYMHRNPQYFPNPERFDPERHTPEAREQRHAYSYLPFGEGPRVCIAERFAMLEMKLCLAVLLRDFTFSTGPSFEPKTVLDVRSFIPRPKNDFNLCISRREKKA